MDMTALFPAVTTAATVGLGCGTCCSPIISTFLSTYVVSHSNGVKKGVLSFVSFFVGKLISVTFLCMVAAVLSSQQNMPMYADLPKISFLGKSAMVQNA